MKQPQKGQQGVTFRSLIIAVLLIPINCYWVIEMEVIRYSGHPVTISLFFNVVFNIFVLIGLNLILKKFLPKHTLTQSELLVIYIMLSLASGIAGHDMLEILVPMLGHAYWFATPENEWAELFHRYLPRWLTVDDKNALDGYYNGEIDLYTSDQLSAWMEPILWWTAFIFALVFVMLCINVIVRRQWTQSEKLSYPIIQLPLEMTNPALGLFKSRFMWMGFGIAGFLTLLNGMNTFFPAIPQIPLRVRYINLFTDKPWNAMGSIPISFYPFAIGLGFFIPLDLAFSCWFFFWFWRFQRVIGSALGLRSLPGFPYMNEQASGGYIALAIIALWISRNHIAAVFRKAIGYRPKLDDSDEPMSYRTAVIGLLAGLGFIVFFCSKYGVSSIFYKSNAGMSLGVILGFFAIYFAISTAVTRMRAELGSPVHDLHYAGPDQIMVRFMGTRRLGAGNLTMFSMFWFINRAYRSHPMPHQLEGFKLAERTNTSNQRLAFAMMLAVVLGSLGAFWALIDRGYRMGMEVRVPSPSLTAFGREPYARLQGWLVNLSGTNYPQAIFTIMGFIFTILLMVTRMRLFWWPFHPAGYAITTSWGMNIIWSCLFFSWLLKLIILKFGGLKVHRQATPFFLGLILGEFTVGSLWTIFGIIFGIQTYGFWV
ncbi:hypothetical protein GF312_13105 [Candidatus Poribacteria bacterium]|nr:hypothetical protein [Candidatus Poribacteria bacterium]